METKKIVFDNKERKSMMVKVKEQYVCSVHTEQDFPHTDIECNGPAIIKEDTGISYEVPMPIEGDIFQLGGVVFKVVYQRDNPFRIAAEPNGEVILDVIRAVIKEQEKNEPKTEG